MLRVTIRPPGINRINSTIRRAVAFLYLVTCTTLRGYLLFHSRCAFSSTFCRSFVTFVGLPPSYHEQFATRAPLCAVWSAESDVCIWLEGEVIDRRKG